MSPDETRFEVVAPSDPAQLASTAAPLAAAFVDDPVWISIGPRRRSHRARANRVIFWGIVRASARHRARIRLVRDPGGPTLGATIAFAAGDWPPPDSAIGWELPWAFLAGPLPVVRGLRDDQAIRAGHVEHPHIYLWYIGVDPRMHSRGAGRALMAELHRSSDEAGLPTYLETGTEKNVGFYGSLGYEVLERFQMPSGSQMWRMERPAAGQTAASASA